MLLAMTRASVAAPWELYIPGSSVKRASTCLSKAVCPAVERFRIADRPISVALLNAEMPSADIGFPRLCPRRRSRQGCACSLCGPIGIWSGRSRDATGGLRALLLAGCFVAFLDLDSAVTVSRGQLPRRISAHNASARTHRRGVSQRGRTLPALTGQEAPDPAVCGQPKPRRLRSASG